MTSYINFSKKFNGETIDDLISRISESLYKPSPYNTSTDENQVVIYINSSGGEVDEMERLLYMIECHKEQITLVAIGVIGSCAFELFSRYTGKKKILKDTIAIVHLYNRDLSSRDLLDSKSFETFIHKDLIRSNNTVLEQYAQFLSKDELKNMSKGQEIYIDYPRLVEMFK